MERTYKAEYENEEMEVFSCDNDDKAMEIARGYEAENGSLWGLWEINEDYEEIRNIV